MHKPVDGAEALAREVLEREAIASGDYASISFEEHGWNPWPIAIRAMLAHSAALVAENERLTKAQSDLEYAIERMVTLTPSRANAADAQEMHSAVRAIGFTALEASPGYNDRPGLINTDPARAALENDNG